MRLAARQLGMLQRRAFGSTPRRLERYAFIGLGQMGFQMAKNLQSKLPASDTICLFDVDSAAMKGVQAATRGSGGAQVELADSVGDATKEADTVITVLPEPQHVASVYESMTASSARPSRLSIDCSTIDPATSRRVAAAVTAAGHGVFLDAPMSGGVVGATAGTLTFMLGVPPNTPLGSNANQSNKQESNNQDSATSRAESTLLRMGRRVLRCGSQGAGLAAKLANNYLLALTNIATAEAMNLGVRSGLDPAVLAAVLNASTGRCWPSEVNNPVPGVIEGAPASRDYAGGFGIALMKKDLRLAMVAADEAGAHMELAEGASRVYREAEAREDCRGRDFSVVYRYLTGKNE